MNPIEILKNYTAKGQKPEQMLMSLLGQKNSNPMLQNLIVMAQKGNVKDVENFARNCFKDKGRDFDKEFSDFMNQIKR